MKFAYKDCGCRLDWDESGHGILLCDYHRDNYPDEEMNSIQIQVWLKKVMTPD